MSSNNRPSKVPWCAVNWPVRASSTCGRLCFKAPSARDAHTWGSRAPATSAASMRRPVTPKRSETTLPSLRLVSSRSLCTRFLLWLRVCTKAQRVRVANIHLDRPNEHMIDRLPIDPGALHRDDGAVLLHEPVGQGEERCISRGKLASLLADLTVGVHTTQTRRERVLVDIDATA